MSTRLYIAALRVMPDADKKIDREKNRDNTHAVLSLDFTRCMAIFTCYLHCPQRFCQKVNPPCADRTTAKKIRIAMIIEW
jgi:hypothetical protein